MSRDDPPLRIRLPEALKAKIQELAGENHRSMNAEIVARLERSVEEDTQQTKAGSQRLSFIATAKKNAIARLDARVRALEDEVDKLKKRLKG